MKLSRDWLGDHLENFDWDAVMERLPQIGLEVESVSAPMKLDGFALAQVVKVRPHPNADKLRVATVRLSDGIYDKTIVCGAPNLYEGQVTILAKVGAVLPSTSAKLKPATIRGVESFGMLCSAAELGIGSDSDGILDLEESDLSLNANAVLGINDWVATLETTPNRPDWAGVQGLARDLAASGCGDLRMPQPIALDESIKSPIEILDQQAGGVCPHFVGRYISGVKNKAAPDWMAKRLRAIGLRSISALVDITNYICFDRARPLHIYDGDKIHKAIILREAKAGESFAALDGKTYALQPNACVIADERSALALGGVMGGVESSVSAETKNIFIESAWFEPTQTARTARAHNLHSDSSYRFERGVDRQSASAGCDLAAKMVQEICGGQVSAKVEHGTAARATETQKIYFVPAQLEKLSGVQISQQDIQSFLDKLGFTTNPKGEGAETTPPSWRFDFAGKENSRAGLALLAGEIVRLYGVDKIPEVPLSVPPRPAAPAPDAVRLKKARHSLAANGLVEIISWSFQSEAVAKIFSPSAEKMRLANPISEELAVMRSSLLGGLLLAAARNLSYGKQPIAFFEAGAVFDDPKPKAQRTHIAALRQGEQVQHWQGNATSDLWQIKADLLAALAAAGLAEKAVRFDADNAPDYFHPAKSGQVLLGTQVLGAFGALHPSLLSQLNVDSPCVAFELDMNALPAKKNKKTQRAAWQPYTFIPVRRDFAFCLDKEVAAATVLQAVSQALKKIKFDVNVFDLFENEKVLGVGKKSLAIEVTLFPEQILRDEDIAAVQKAIVASVEEKTGGVLRG